MARATFVKKARKAIPKAGIKKGDSYWWWKFKGCPKSVSKEKPKPSQLTRSEFWSRVFQLQERNGPPAFDDCENELDEIKGELEEIKDECEEKFNNMPDGLQQGDTGQLLEERISALDDCISELEGIDLTIEDSHLDEDAEEERDQLKTDRAAEIWDEITEALGNISCG